MWNGWFRSIRSFGDVSQDLPEGGQGLVWNENTMQYEPSSSAVVIAGNLIRYETPTPATDGAETNFSVANPYVAGTLKVFRDGVDIGCTEDDPDTGAFSLASAPDADEDIWCDYLAT